MISLQIYWSFHTYLIVYRLSWSDDRQKEWIVKSIRIYKSPLGRVTLIEIG